MEAYCIMRLKNIKLAGFKSFVDATTIHFPSDLVAVLGPNGCGKSNVIDAVRWVMGESSAKQLRGESMADVIFNGSSSRQPLAQASVELNFDNSNGSLGGEYAEYGEIAVRREVTLDGQSTYYLNGVRCRRRDITNIFLGTGLGPRSYAIIKQDTISSIIEAKPEELRVYLEEAAGISKYKERRKETETRIRHTRENLERLEDVRGELAKQLEHLQRQAKAAERYKVYKEEETLLKSQLHALNWRGLDISLQQQKQQLADKETTLESVLAEQRNAEAALEKQRQTQREVSEAFNEVQARYYQAGSDIARLEQSLQHGRERGEQLANDQQQIEQEWQALTGHITTDKQRNDELSQQIEQKQPEVNSANAQSQTAVARVADAEEDMAAWQSEWDSFTAQAAAINQRAEVNKTRLVHLEEQFNQSKNRIQRLQDELAQSIAEEQPQALAAVEERMQAEEQILQELQQTLAGMQTQLNEQRQSNTALEQQLADARSELQALQGQHASLTVLQQAALGQRNESIVDWLVQHDLDKKPRLAQQLQVQSGWERAVETVLGDYLQAVCVDSLEASTCEALASIAQGQLCLFAGDQATTSNGQETLASKITAGVAPWLNDIYVADNLSQALEKTKTLASHQSVVTPEGIWLGQAWLRVACEDDDSGSVLQREQELATINESIIAQQEKVEQLQSQLQQGQEQQLVLERERDEQQAQINQATQVLAKTRSEFRIQTAKHEQLQKRQLQLNKDLEEQQQLLQQGEAAYAQVRADWQAAVSQLEETSEQRELLAKTGDAQRETLAKAQQQRQQLADEAYHLAVELESFTSQLEAINQNDGRMQQQLSQLEQRREQLQQSVQDTKEPLQAFASELEQKLQQRLEIAESMDGVRQQLGGVEGHISSLENKRTAAEQGLETLRSELEGMRLESQTVSVRQKTIEEQLLESQQDLSAVLQALPEDAESGLWEEKLSSLQSRIQRLGAINLAAIEECETLSERKTYLDQQNEDLLEALQTLEDAIHKIDQETRTRFKASLEQVSNDFEHLFPRIFGGGSAKLELTEDNLLEAGIVVKARPPGKQNSSIHLLSGGEKALTAIALVFAIFQLNPAPFCMLDEVDAPLDDANVMRFSKLVKDMSEKVQFIFITHNKVTMEMAHHLMGVTMNEPGVSRVVSVDVGDALALAEA